MLRLLKIAAPLLALLLALSACSSDGDVTDPDDPDTWHELPWRNDHSSDVTRPGLPTLRINTPDGRDIESKEEYVMKCEVLLTREDGGRDLYGLAAVKGRGNTTWWDAPKKPYALHFHSAQSVLGRPKANTWTLLANYHDNTLVRNDIALWMGREMSHLDFTPDPAFVYLHLNGKYRGVYQICEKLKLGPNRVRAGADGFLLEIDKKSDEGEITFPLAHLPDAVINIKEPEEIAVGDDNYNYIRDYVTAFEEALFSDDFLDPEKGYAKYIDEDSFVEWYLVNEIAKNCDAKLWTSCYMNLRRGEKLKMGPLWDFDVAFGGFWETDFGITVLNVPTGFYIMEASWFQRLFMSPTFVAKVKNRFADYFRDRQQIYNRIDASAAQVKPLIYNENLLWERLCDTSLPRRDVEDLYDDLIDRLKAWIELRMLWLNEHVAAL